MDTTSLLLLGLAWLGLRFRPPKLQHWSGLTGIFRLKPSSMLEFWLPTEIPAQI
jgi:hypothetical protein